MAGATDPDKSALTAEIASARERLSGAGGSLRASLDLPSRAAESFRRHRTLWIAGAALTGFLLSKIPARKKTVYVETVSGKTLGGSGKAGFIWTVAKFLFGTASPLFGDLAGKILGEIAGKFGRAPEANRPPRSQEPP